MIPIEARSGVQVYLLNIVNSKHINIGITKTAKPGVVSIVYS